MRHFHNWYLISKRIIASYKNVEHFRKKNNFLGHEEIQDGGHQIFKMSEMEFQWGLLCSA